MPVKAYNVSRQRSRGNAITINGLLTWRAKRLRSLRIEPNSEADHKADIAAIDRVLVNVLGFRGDIEALTRDYRREALFKRNELRRAVLVVLRQANGPLTTREITERVMATKGKALKPGKLSRCARCAARCRGLSRRWLMVFRCCGEASGRVREARHT